MDVSNAPSVDKSPDRIRRMFDAVAPRYDLINHLLSLGIDYTWRNRTARQIITLQLLEGNILDVCCGTGDLSLAFYKRQQRITTARTNFGIDFSPEMLEIARKKSRHIPTLQFAEGDALDLPFAEDTFATVAVAFGLRNVQDIQQGLTEMVRVCKPGGTVAVLEFSLPTLPVLRHCYQFYFRIVLPRIGQWVGKNKDKAYNYFTASVMQFDKPQELANRFRQLGLTDVHVKPMTLGIVSLIWGRKQVKRK